MKPFFWICVILCLPCTVSVQGQEDIIGMYVHAGWPYHHPYAARTWSVEDWRGYAGAMKQLGYNTLMFWPVVETMPEPLTQSDQAALDRFSQAIDVIHNELDMRLFITIAPNIGVKDTVASKYSYEDRYYYESYVHLNPGDATQLTELMSHRVTLLEPLAQMDGLVIIDSDPGGYPGSTNEEFVLLFEEHRKLLDQLRPGIELIYWMWAGWQAYARFFETATFRWGENSEFLEVLNLLSQKNLEPWGLLNGLNYAQQVGLQSKVIGLNYGSIEGEPAYPFTNFGGGGVSSAPRGAMGNAQNHALQLPNTYAFARRAQRLPLATNNYIRFANDLISGQGALIVQAWQTLSSSNSQTLKTMADQLEALNNEQLTHGSFGGLLFGDPQRFINDLVMQLRVKASLKEVTFSTECSNESGFFESYQSLVSKVQTWQNQHGYQHLWIWSEMEQVLRRLDDSEINEILNQAPLWYLGEGATPFERILDGKTRTETYTPRLVTAMVEALDDEDLFEITPSLDLATGPTTGLLPLTGANWAGDDYTQGGLDGEKTGDKDTLVASGEGFLGFPAEVCLGIELTRDYSQSPQVEFTVGYRTNGMQTRKGTVLWDDVEITTITAHDPQESLRTKTVTVSNTEFDFSPGEHAFTIQATESPDITADFFEVDAVRITTLLSPAESQLRVY